MGFDMHDSLNALGPLPYSELPLDDLSPFLKQIFHHAEILVNSIPTPPSTSNQSPLDASSLPPANSAKTPAETLLDPSHLPRSNLQIQHPDLTKPWGKPVKISAKDNPLMVAIFKRAAHDRHGAWFSRRSVHSGVGFTRFERAMRREFLESLGVHDGPGSGAVRGISADRRVEHHEVKDGLGSVDIWQLSSAFPGPVTPREFVALSITSACATGDGSRFEGIETIPRTFMAISRPMKHPEVKDRSDLVLGTYESVEFIREVPVAGVTDREQNPVEWIMITRSDPGGGIPKFMVERGTPGSIVADVPKWLTWAIAKGDIADDQLQIDESEIQKHNEIHDDNKHEADDGLDEAANEQRSGTLDASESSINNQAASEHSTGGWIGSIQHAVEGYLPTYFHHHDADSIPLAAGDVSDDASSTTSSSSGRTFRSAEDTHPSLSGLDASSPLDSDEMIRDIEARGGPSNSHERELVKLHAKRAALEAKAAAARENAGRASEEKLKREEKERSKAEERRERERRKQEENFRRQIEKLDRQREKEAKKVEERQRKALARDETATARRERDEARERLKVAEQEAAVLRRQVESLQRENTMLVARLGAIEGGGEAVRKVRGDLDKEGRSRASSRSSKKSSGAASLGKEQQ